ncbi:MAG: MBL fold metallo-hydrolase [Candidatus Omnitrophica bacterium]|nr:MBL fold metallo-hydrolase [Candidatus Omnitrophota bacterium]
MSKITVTILGTTAAVPTRTRAHAAIYIDHSSDKEFCCLFDCGEGTQRQILFAGLNLMKLDNIFITHWHGDHCLGLPGVVDTMGFENRKRQLNVFAPESQRVKKCLGFSYSIGKINVKTHDVQAKGKKITELFENDRLRIVSIPVKHSRAAVAYALFEKDKTGIDLGKAMKLGLPEKGEIYRQLKEEGSIAFGSKIITLEEISSIEKGKRIVYSGDTEICENLRKLASNADLLIQDCTYFEEEGAYKHAALPEILKMVKECKVARVVLTHISRKYQSVNALKKLIKKYPNVEIAEDLMELVVE